jgi:hypothetical protein
MRVSNFHDELFSRFVTNGVGVLYPSLMKDLLVEDEYIGITNPTQSGKPIFEAIANIWIVEKDLSPEIQEKVMNIIKCVCADFAFSPYSVSPDYSVSPNLTWLLAFANSELFPFKLMLITKNIGEITAGFRDDQLEKYRIRICKLTWAFRHYLCNADKKFSDAIKKAKTNHQLINLIINVIDLDPPPSSTTRITYITNICRLVINKKVKIWEERNGYTNLPKDDSFDFYHVDTDKIIEYENPEITFEELDYIAVSKETSEDPLNTQSFSDAAKKKIDRDPFLMSTKTIPTWNSPGVLTKIELVLLFQALYDLENKNELLGLIARVLILSQLFYGWKYELVGRLLVNCKTIKRISKGVCLYKVALDSPVGWPKQLISQILAGKSSKYLKDYCRHFEKPSLNYPMPIHPIISSALIAINKKGAPISAKLIKESWKAFEQIASKYLPHKISHAKLRLTFRGLSSFYGLDYSDQYVITGLILSYQIMPINYTQIFIGESVAKTWKYINEIINSSLEQFDMLYQNNTQIPWLTPTLYESNYLKQNLFAGSWSITKKEHIRKLIRFLRQIIIDPNIPPYQRHNFKLTYLAICSILLTLARPFEFENMAYCTGYEQKGTSVYQKAKSKKGDENHVLRQIPSILQSLFWECMEECKSDYVDGSIWCIRDIYGKRVRFDIQDQIDFCLKQIAMADIYIRDYGLRHLGRTLHRMFSFPEYYLNYKMQHDFLGGEEHNPCRPGYKDYKYLNSQIIEEICKELGII